MELSDWNQTQERLLVFGLAAFLGLQPDEVQVKNLEKGSVKVIIELPITCAHDLATAFQANRDDLAQMLKELPIEAITLPGNAIDMPLLQLAVFMSISQLGTMQCIARENGFYYFTTPFGATEILATGIRDSGRILSTLLAHSDEAKTLRDLSSTVISGFAPRVIEHLIDIPFLWRAAEIQLRREGRITPGRQSKIDDYQFAAYGLARSLDGLANSLAEQLGISETSPDQWYAPENRKQSMMLLKAFADLWARSSESPKAMAATLKSVLQRDIAKQELFSIRDSEWLNTASPVN